MRNTRAMKQAVAVVLKTRGAFLLIKRAKKGEAEDYWCPITGAVEQDETEEQAVVREAHEEMGISVQPLRKVWECYTDNKKYLLHWWHAKLIQPTMQPNPDEVKDYRWVTLPQMYTLKMFDADLRFFETIAPGLLDS